MNEQFSTGALFLEIGQSSLKALRGENGLELPLERLENGRLTAACRERLQAALQGFAGRGASAAGKRALCAIGARGVSLRRLTLPAAGKEEFGRILRMQIESEFPLPPEELAWGSVPCTAGASARSGAGEWLVVAVKKEVIQEYADLLMACGLDPVFTLAAWARNLAGPQSRGDQALLDIGRAHSELICFEDGLPVSVRVISWGGENWTRAIQESRRVSHDEAERLKLNPDPATGGAPAELDRALAGLVAPLKSAVAGKRVYLSGKTAAAAGFAMRLSATLGGVSCERIQVSAGEGRSAAILGLRKSCESGGPRLVIECPAEGMKQTIVRPAVWQWVARAAVLLLAVLVLPYAEAYIQTARLEKKLAMLQSDQARLPMIDSELDFLQYVKSNQPPYLDAVYLVANSTAPGFKVETLSMNRRGELAMRGKFNNAQQVMDFRSKLIESHFFSSVVIEEQTPGPNNQMTVRMSALWKAPVERESLKIEPAAKDAAKTDGKTNAPAGKSTNAASTSATGTNAAAKAGKAAGTNATNTAIAKTTNSPAAAKPITNAPAGRTPDTAKPASQSETKH